MSMIQIRDFRDEDCYGTLKIHDAFVYDFDESIRASKFPMLTDTSKATSMIEQRQISLAQCEGGTGHDNYLQGILVAFNMDITVKALIEAERYHFLDIVSSNSTMHRIVKFDMNDCYNPYVDQVMIGRMVELIEEYNANPTEENYLRVLYSNPCGFTYTIRFTTNYRQLKTIYKQRKNHKLPEWKWFCQWIEDLPHSYLITGEGKEAA